MKIRLFIIACLITTLSFASGLKTFVPKDKGYEEVEISDEQKTIKDICNYLGYNSDQFYSYFDTDVKGSKIFMVIFKVFTNDIICVFTEDTVTSIDKTDIAKYLVNYDFNKAFNSYEIESTLSDGVKNKSLTKEFLEGVFKQNNNSKDKPIIALSIGYELHFKNGILTKYNTTDGFNKWSKIWKNELPSTFNEYKKSAEKYWDNKLKVIEEINTQSDAFSRVPNGVLNEYIKFHTNSDGTVNYKMLLVAHYKEKITLSEFKEINNGRFSLSTEFNDKDGYKRTTYKVNNGLYTFDGNEILVNIYTSE
jgi:hypothetical protein